MDNFDKALTFTLKWEGGFSDDADDRGGATMNGVTQGEYDRYRRQQGHARQSVKFISREELRDIYLGYWSGAHSGAFALPLAMTMFDIAVNNGIGRAIRFYQELRRLGVDGVVGPKTRADMHKVGEMPPVQQREFALRLVDRRAEFYAAIVRNNPTQKKFLNGWNNRNNDLRKTVLNS